MIDALGRPVRGAEVQLEGGSGPPVRTDRAGRFQLVARLGQTLVITGADLDTGLATVTGAELDDIVLLTADQASETIEISGEAPPGAPGAARLDREELQRVPGTGGDVVKALSAMPGVVNSQLPVGYNGVPIRGSSPQDSKILIDDFEIPLLFHDIAARSVVPAEAIDKLEYLPGGFDVAHGRASSGIVVLTTRPGSDQRTAQAEMSVIDGGVLAQGRVGRTRYMAALRRSTIDLVLPSLMPDDLDLSLTTVPRYWDEQLRIDHDLTDRWRLTASSIGSDDILEISTTKQEDVAAKRFYSRMRFVRMTLGAAYHGGPWSAKLALSGLAQNFHFEAGENQYVETKTLVLTPRAEIARTAPELAGLRNVVWRFGGEVQLARGVVDVAIPYEQGEGEPPPAYDPDDVSEKFRGTVWLPNFAAWTALAADLHARIRLTTGVRTDVLAQGNEVAIQPRGELAVKLTPRAWTARLTAGSFRRAADYNAEALYDYLKSERATQLIAGLQLEPREGVRVQGSAYYTARSALITRDDAGMLGNNGRGTTVGAELLATYRTARWFGWLSYAYTRSRRTDQPGEMERVFSYDQPHSLNAAGSVKLGRWQLGGRFQLYSGMPYTPTLGATFDSDRNIYEPVYGAPNTERNQLHHQLDLRIDRSWRVGGMLLTGFLDVQNVYANESTIEYVHSFDYSQRAGLKSIPILPSIGIKGVL